MLNVETRINFYYIDINISILPNARRTKIIVFSWFNGKELAKVLTRKTWGVGGGAKQLPLRLFRYF